MRTGTETTALSVDRIVGGGCKTLCPVRRGALAAVVVSPVAAQTPDFSGMWTEEDGDLSLVRLIPAGLDTLATTPLFSTTAWMVPRLVGTTRYARDRRRIVVLDLDGQSRPRTRVDSPVRARYHVRTMTGWHRLSCREMLKRTAVLGAAASVPLRVAVAASQAVPLDGVVTLTASEADTLEAVVARIIPTDKSGPGATEAKAPYYIDRALKMIRAGGRILCERCRKSHSTTRAS